MFAFLTAIFAASAAFAQMPPGLPNRDSYAIRKIDPAAPCRLESELQKIRSQKSDLRVAYVELEPLVVPDKDDRAGFKALCKELSEQTEDGVVVFDKTRGYLNLISGSPVISTTLAYFAPVNAKDAGVILYVSRWDDDWKTFAFAWRDNKWVNVSKEYLGGLQLKDNELLILPQYGRTLRVLAQDGEAFRHKQWLTWDGKSFKPLDAKTGQSTWKCPDSFRYFEPRDRAQYCR